MAWTLGRYRSFFGFLPIFSSLNWSWSLKGWVAGLPYVFPWHFLRTYLLFISVVAAYWLFTSESRQFPFFFFSKKWIISIQRSYLPWLQRYYYLIALTKIWKPASGPRTVPGLGFADDWDNASNGEVIRRSASLHLVPSIRMQRRNMMNEVLLYGQIFDNYLHEPEIGCKKLRNCQQSNVTWAKHIPLMFVWHCHVDKVTLWGKRRALF